MATISGIRVDGYTFCIEHDTLDIKRAYIGFGGGIDVWPILADRVRLAIFDQAFKEK